MEKDSTRPAEPRSLPVQHDFPALKGSTAAADGRSKVGMNGSDPPPSCQSHRCDPAASGPPKDTEPSITRLCGYLDKLGGPLKSWKNRWFCYDEKRCQLLYYRTAQHGSPLGRIELADAVFGYPDQADKDAFHIQTPERTFILKAVSRDAMIYWLQQLQLRRWRHRYAPESRQAGVKAGMGGEPEYSPSQDTFLPIVKTPTGLVGHEAAYFPAPPQQASLSNVSFKHLLTEFQNSMNVFRRKHHSQEMNRSVFYCSSDPGSLLQENPGLPVTGQEEPPGGDPLNTSLFLFPETKKNGIPATPPKIKEEAGSLEIKTEKETVPETTLNDGQNPDSGMVTMQGGQVALLLRLPLLKRDGPDLDDHLQNLDHELAVLRQQLAERDAYVAEMQSHLQLMMEKNRAKQEVILRLSQQVEECMEDPRHMVFNSMGTQSFCQLQVEMDQFRDDIEAYKIQNRFLNSEIYQLTELWRNSSEQQKILMKRCAFLEGKCCKMESRYLDMLHKLQETKGLGSEQRAEVGRLIKEALQEDTTDTGKLPICEHDEYGFKLIQDLDIEDMKLLTKIQSLEIYLHSPLQQEAMDKSRLSRWAQYLGGRPLEDLVASPELKTLLRGGVPSQYRAGVWRWVVWTRTHSIREKDPQRYQELCKKSQTSQHPASRQIQLDLQRTLTSNQHFSSPSSPCVEQLHRILLAFSWQNPSIGYCQGLNRLAAIALLVLQNEEEAFWCLVTVVETIMPQDYYSKTLIASQADQRVLKDIMIEKLPRLMAHLEEHNVDVSLITFNWFLVVFVESLTSRILLRIWDAFLYEGTKVIFRYALAIFKYKEEDILKIQNTADIYQYLHFFNKTIFDGRKLNNIAFVDMNPFPMKLLRNRRMHHLERLKAELRELELIQREFLTVSTEHKDKDLDPAVGEDEEDL